MQLEIALVLSQIFAFLALLWIMKKFAWKPFLNTLETRSKKIEDEFKQIEEQKHHLNELTATYTAQLASIDDLLKEKLKETSVKSDQLAQKIQEEAQNQARAILEKTREEISQEIKTVQAQLKEKVVNLVIETTEKMLGEKIDPTKDRQRVEQFVAGAELK